MGTGTIDFNEVAGAAAGGAVSAAILAVAAPASLIGAAAIGGIANVAGGQVGSAVEAALDPSGSGFLMDFSSKGGFYNGSNMYNIDKLTFDFASGAVINGAFTGTAHLISKYTTLLDDPIEQVKPGYSKA
jgi:hypothetical protein